MNRPEHTWVCVGAQEILSRAGELEAWCYLFGDHPGDKGYMQRRAVKAGLFQVGERYTTRQIVEDVFAANGRGTGCRPVVRSQTRSQAGVS